MKGPPGSFNDKGGHAGLKPLSSWGCGQMSTMILRPVPCHTTTSWRQWLRWHGNIPTSPGMKRAWALALGWMPDAENMVGW
jgi:hypothetical protein